MSGRGLQTIIATYRVRSSVAVVLWSMGERNAMTRNWEDEMGSERENYPRGSIVGKKQ